MCSGLGGLAIISYKISNSSFHAKLNIHQLFVQSFPIPFMSLADVGSQAIQTYHIIRTDRAPRTVYRTLSLCHESNTDQLMIPEVFECINIIIFTKSWIWSGFDLLVGIPCSSHELLPEGRMRLYPKVRLLSRMTFLSRVH